VRAAARADRGGMNPTRTIKTILATAAALAACSGSAVAAPGDLDDTFGTGGLALHDLEGNGGDDYARDVAIQPDGKVVVAGVARPTSGDDGAFLVARYLPDGSPDPSFGDAGRTLTKVSNGSVHDEAHALALDTEGRIVVAGESHNPSGGTLFAVARYMPDGQLDGSFSGDGRLRFLFPGSVADDHARAVALDGDKIVVAGQSRSVSQGHRAAIARLAEDGGFDNTFDGDGLVTTSAYNSAHSDSIADVIRQPDGTLVAVGSTQRPDGHTGLSVFRFTSEGDLDWGFAEDGIVETTFGEPEGIEGHSFGAAVVREPDGDLVVVGGRGSSSGTDAVLARYRQDGQLDDSFAGDGRAVLDIGPTDAARDLARQPDGKLVVGGYVAPADTAAFRVTAAGELDASFAGDGVATHDAGSEDGADAVALQPDGVIVTAGSAGVNNGSEQDTAVVRWLGDPSPAEPAEPVKPAQPTPPGTPAPSPNPQPRPLVGRCANRIAGTRRRDVLSGTRGGDRLSGRRGNDVLRGRGGDDCLSGGRGNDVLSGGKGRNRYSAGAGNDRVNARNGVRDTVKCGRGRDSVRADRSDRLRGCERINRRSSR
jgi:uncharacterized delta-60 repeat protein